MKYSVLTAFVLGTTGLLLASGGSDSVDSTDLIFNDAEVHQYRLTYYIPNWIDTMEYNKEDNGEAYMPARFCYKAPGGDSIVLDSIGVRYKGNSSYTLAKQNAKKSFKLAFDEYKKQSFFSCKKLNLNNCIEDPSYMREKIGYDIIRHYMATPRVAYAVLYVNDTMIGVFAQVEQVDKNFLQRNFAKSGGTLFKAGDNGAALDYKGPNKVSYESIYEIKENKGDEDAWNHLITMIYKLNDTLSGVDKIVEKTSPHLNFTNAIAHLTWTIVLSHFDSYTGTGRNYYLYDDPLSGQFVIIPWDVNMAFGQLPYQWNVITNSAFNIANLDVRPLNKRIIDDPVLKNLYIACIREMISGPASAENVAKEADRIKAIIDPWVKLEPDANRFYPYDDFVKNIDEDLVIPDGFNEIRIPGIKSFSAARNAELIRQCEAGVAYHPDMNARATAKALHGVVDARASAIDVDFSLQGAGKSLSLFDGNGRVVKRRTLGTASGNVTLDMAAMPAGIYILSLTNGTTTLSDRVVFAR